MVAYSFDRMHEHAVESGAKCMTIRAPRKRHARPGEALQLYSARGSGKRLLRRATCAAVRTVRLVIEAGVLRAAWIDGAFTEPRWLAIEDGFASAADMGAFFTRYHAPGAAHVDFTGVLIEWR